MPQASSQAMGLLKGPAKLQAVTLLMDRLRQDLKKICMLPQQRDAALEELKLYGRDPAYADPIFTKDGIDTLTRHAFHSPSNVTSRNALRVLANALLLKPATRQIFVDLQYEPDPGKARLSYVSKACNKLKNDSWDDEFLIGRILFLTTYGTTIKLIDIIDQNALAEILVQKMASHAKLLEPSSKAKSDPMEAMAMLETLKLMFNLSHFCPTRVSTFTAAVPHIVAILNKQTVSALEPMEHPVRDLINALLNLELDSKDVQAVLFPRAAPVGFCHKLVDILDKALKAYPDNELEQSVTPLIGVLRKLHATAPLAARQHMQAALLPTEEDRKVVLGKGRTMPSRLLKNSSNPMTPQLREAISHLLFDLSDKDASKFVENVGYGFASGFLFQNGIPVPANASEASAVGDAKRAVNPITGQFMDLEADPNEPEMTEEEKEREADRLFVLFERLRRTGIVDVEHPMRTAVESGRITELKDDDSSD